MLKDGYPFPNLLKTAIYLMVTGISLTACHRREKIVVSGVIPGGKKQMVYVDLLNINAVKPVDSVRTGRKGTFRFHIPLSEPSFLLLKRTDKNFITLLAKPGEHIRILADSTFLPAGYEVSGSKGSLQVKQLDDRLQATVRKTDSITAVYRHMMNNPGFDTLKPKLDKAYKKVLAAQQKFNISFIINHMHSLASIKALYQKIDANTYVLNDIKDLQYMKIVSDSLKVYYPNIKMTKALLGDFKKEMSQYNQMHLNSLIKNAKKVKLELALPDIQGDTIRLSSLRGKYVLLTFWASWCQQCITENQELKSIYRKYHSRGLEIYAVSLDNKKDAWSQAVHFDELPWINVSGLDYPHSKAAEMFNVKIPPANFLFDTKGDIIGRNLHGRNLQIKLSQIFD